MFSETLMARQVMEEEEVEQGHQEMDAEMQCGPLPIQKLEVWLPAPAVLVKARHFV